MGPISVELITNSFDKVLISFGGVLNGLSGALATKVFENGPRVTSSSLNLLL